MAGVNKAVILGRLGRDPEFQTTQNGMAICKFSMATSRKQKNGEEVTQWHNFVSFNKSAELINQYVKKGDQLYVEGEINYSEYEKDGVKKYFTNIVVREFNFIGGGQSGQQGQQGGYQPPVPPQQQYQPPQQQGYNPQNQRPSQGGGHQTPPGPDQGYQPQGQGSPPAPPGPVGPDDIPF